MEFIDSMQVSYMQNLGLALMTLIVPIGIYILREKEPEYNELDRSIRFKLIGGKDFLIELGWVFLPVMFWNSIGDSSELYVIKGVVMFSWTLGIILIMKRVVKLYIGWIKLEEKDRDDIRREHIEEEIVSDKLILFWKSIWEKKLGANFDRVYFEVFLKKISECIDKKRNVELKLAGDLLKDFNAHIDRRDTTFLVVFDVFFPRILSWHKKVWHDQLENKKTSDEQFFYSELLGQLDFIVREIIGRASKDDHFFILLRYLCTHLEKNGNYSIKIEREDHYYLNRLPIFRELLEGIPDSQDTYSVWNHYFPEEWKITEKNFRKSRVVKFWWHYYKDWAGSRININGKDDRKLDQVSENLIPGINPITWAIILTFAFRSWGGNRMKNLIEQWRNFGFTVSGDGDYHSKKTFWDDFKKEIDQKEDYTIELACFLLKGCFRDIDQHLKSLEGLKFEDRDDENYRKEILRIFKKIKVKNEV